MAKFLPYGKQWVDEDDIQAVAKVLAGDFLTTGPNVDAFEAALCEATTASFATAVNSGTSALHVMYFAAGLKAGDEIITSPMTFAATANAALYLGASVKFVDVEADTGNLNPELIEDAVSEQTKLIVPIDFTGHPADYDPINAIAERHNLTVVADAAHSLGASYKGRPVGTLAAATELSFHPVKPVTTAEGGAVVTNDPEIDKRSKRFRTHGITKNSDEMLQNEGPWFYEMQDLGFNYRITDIQCALGLNQMKKLPSFIQRRRAIAAMYDQAFVSLPELILPTQRSNVESGWHLYVIRVAEDPSKRLVLFERLRELGLGVQVHYIPVHYHPYYKELGFKKGQFPNAEDYYARAISLPMYPRMTNDDVASVIERVSQAVKEIL